MSKEGGKERPGEAGTEKEAYRKYEKLTQLEYRPLLKERGLRIGGSKKQAIERLVDYDKEAGNLELAQQPG